MSRLKTKPRMAEAQAEPKTPEASSVTLVTSSMDTTAHHSPALALQMGLEQSWDARHKTDSLGVEKIPFAWTLIGMSAVCAAFWYMIAQLLF